MTIKIQEKTYSYVINKDVGVYVFIAGEDDSRFVSVNERSYPHLIQAINLGDAKGVEEHSRPKIARLTKLLAETNGVLSISEEGEVLDNQGFAVSNMASNYVKQMMDVGVSPLPLIRLMERIRKNPSFRAQKELAGWIQHAQMAITPEGKILAYKKVNKDFTSIHDGTFRNDVGTVVEMPRGAVDDDANRTCSKGLHFCSKEYLPHFGSSNPNGMRIVLLEIDPEDVVSIPVYYNNTKGRACKYKILKDVTEEFEDLIKELDTSVVYDYNDDPDFDDADFNDAWEDYENDYPDFDDEEEEEEDNHTEINLDSLTDEELRQHARRVVEEMFNRS